MLLVFSENKVFLINGSNVDLNLSFLGLNDTPNSYAGDSNFLVSVNPSATGLVFIPRTDINVSGGGSTVIDTNWQTSWAIFDVNMLSYYVDRSRSINQTINGDKNFLGKVYFDSNVLPTTDNAKDLGDPNLRFRDFYLGRNLSDGTNAVSIANIMTLNTTQTASGAKTFSNRITRFARTGPGSLVDVEISSNFSAVDLNVLSGNIARLNFRSNTSIAPVPNYTWSFTVKNTLPTPTRIGMAIGPEEPNRFDLIFDRNGSIILGNDRNSFTINSDVNLHGDFNFNRPGKTITFKKGTGACAGLAPLTGGTVIVNTTCADSNYMVLITAQNQGGTPGFIGISAKNDGNFTITSLNILDTSSVYWEIRKII